MTFLCRCDVRRCDDMVNDVMCRCVATSCKKMLHCVDMLRHIFESSHVTQGCIYVCEVEQVCMSRPCVGSPSGCVQPDGQSVIIIVRVDAREDFAPYFLHMRWGYTRGKVGDEEMLARRGVARGKVWYMRP